MNDKAFGKIDILPCPLIEKDMFIMTSKESGKMFCKHSWDESKKQTTKKNINKVLEILHSTNMTCTCLKGIDDFADKIDEIKREFGVKG